MVVSMVREFSNDVISSSSELIGVVLFSVFPFHLNLFCLVTLTVVEVAFPTQLPFIKYSLHLKMLTTM